MDNSKKIDYVLQFFIIGLWLFYLIGDIHKENFDKRWPTSYYEQGGWYTKKPVNRSNYRLMILL